MLEVVEASGISTVQDLGRRGWRRFGVPGSGPMDEFALMGANMLAGNGPEAAAIEVGAGDLTLEAQQDGVIAVAGDGFELDVNVWTYPLWGSYFVRRGWIVRLRKTEQGMWAYVAVAGGIEAPPVLGSRSTYLRGRFGGVEGQALQAGQELRKGEISAGLIETAGRTIVESCRPSYGSRATLDVISGPQQQNLTEGSLQTYFSASYLVSRESDRMGYRLEGPRLTHQMGSELISEGLAPGCIQVPADGSPIVMMADSATTGGYPKIGCVVRADLPKLAQCRPGKDEVRFRETTVEEAQRKYRDRVEQLRSGLREAE
jgi:antagonist of KipI